MERKRLTTPVEMPSGGTNCKLDDAMIQSFCKLVREGLSVDGVCDYLGIASTTYWTWLRKGEKYLAGNNQPAEFAIYGKFVLTFKRAFAEYRLDRTRSLHSPANLTWYRDLAILERRDRKTWGRDEQAGGDDTAAQPDESFL